MTVDQLGLIKSPSLQKTSTLPRVLVAGAGGPSGVAAIKALNGETLDIFSADIDPNAPGLNLVDEDRRLPVAKEYRDSYTELLFELCERHRIDVLIPALDCELLLLASARVFFAEIGTRIVLPSEKTLRACLDRRALRRCCRGVVRVSDSALADDLPGAEYSLATLARSDGKVIAVVPWARGDSGAEASGRTVHDEGLEKIGHQIAERIGLTSLANIQVKEASNGEPVLLEVNPYFTGAMPLVAASGVSMPKLCVDGVLADD
ncbi:MAG: carbamoyl-phosphate synthase large subunit [Solirubrobacterales bacterium]|jgi:carbamoyl-phosphate synthase large subunit|nr:carbamoyl-phosphate synthase large subunit [Solirubrobacterales bacterium]